MGSTWSLVWRLRISPWLWFSAGDLPPDLAAFLESQHLSCLLIGTVRGSSFVIKAPGGEIEGLRGPIPVLFRQELYRHPSSPVIRLLLRIYDRPPSALALESFVNVDDEGQRSDYGNLSQLDTIDLHFYDESLAHRLTKQIPNNLRMEVRSPSGETRWLKHPWSVLAFQIAGADGLRLLHPEGQDAERESAPAENLLVDLLSRPAAEDLATLVLIDEVLTYAHEKAALDPVWRGRLRNFFQYLTQAASRVDRTAIVASLLATDPRMNDTLGKELALELYAIFRREREEGVQPVVKEDVAEVLRRRFFKPESIRDRAAFRPHVLAALKGITELDDQPAKDRHAEEERFLKSYPFHPDLTEVFYAKWTNLEGFQRTRGILRTFAVALRSAEAWDAAPLVGVNVFLSPPGEDAVSEAGRELTTVAAIEEVEGRHQAWTNILEGELDKARQIQTEIPGLRNHREMEQAVFATFLHSQPIGQRALTRELMVLVGPTHPDKIEFEKGLRRWTEISWFLDETALQEAEPGPDGQIRLPRSWRLGSKPNLRQMHHDACTRLVSQDLVDAKVLAESRAVRSLTAGAMGAGVGVHMLPERPGDIPDDGLFRYAVLGPAAASDVNRPSAEARRFLDETTTRDRPRVNRNALVLVVPSRDGLEAIRSSVRAYLGWEEVREQLKDQDVDPLRREVLGVYLEDSRKQIPLAIREAYTIVVAASAKNEIEAFKVAPASDSLFGTIRADARARIQASAVTAEALLPEGPYNLWDEGETNRRVRDLVGAFSRDPHLPKMLSRQAIVDTLVDGCRSGTFVLATRYPDQSLRTFWREEVDDVALKDPTLEVVLPEAAELSRIEPTLLRPGQLPELWRTESIDVQAVLDYFADGRVVDVPRDGYVEPIAVPRAPQEIVETAIGEAVREERLWLTLEGASILGEEVPAGLLVASAQLRPPPQPIPPTALLPDALPGAWSRGTATGLSIATALSDGDGPALPWATVRDAITGAIRAQLVRRSDDSGPWPCDYAEAGSLRLRLPTAAPPPPPPGPSPQPGTLVAEAELRPSEIQDLADAMGEIRTATAGLDVTFRVRIEVSGEAASSDGIAERLNEILKGISDELQIR
jgi:hypothetical protein